jgi:hypothetical protein
VYVYIDLKTPYTYHIYYNSEVSIMSVWLIFIIIISYFLVSKVIIILASLKLRRLLGLPSRAIRVTARNIRFPSFNLRPEDSSSFLNYALLAPS